MPGISTFYRDVTPAHSDKTQRKDAENIEAGCEPHCKSALGQAEEYGGNVSFLWSRGSIGPIRGSGALFDGKDVRRKCTKAEKDTMNTEARSGHVKGIFIQKAPRSRVDEGCQKCFFCG